MPLPSGSGIFAFNRLFLVVRNDSALLLATHFHCQPLCVVVAAVYLYPEMLKDQCVMSILIDGTDIAKPIIKHLSSEGDPYEPYLFVPMERPQAERML